VTRRTELQLALLVMGLIVWGYGQRTENERLTWIGIGFFGVATALRLLKRRKDADAEPRSNDDTSSGPSD
jgi:hypothetical protein